MKRFLLREPIVVEGRDFWNRKSTLVIGPRESGEDNWVWRIGENEVPITPDLFELRARGRTVALEHKGRYFHEFEHLAFLHLLGLRDIYIELKGSDWPPYLCSADIWSKIGALQSGGTLVPYCFDRSVSVLKQGPLNRFVSYTPEEDLCILTAEVWYSPEQSGSHCLVVHHGKRRQKVADIGPVVRARSLGRPALVRPVLSLAARLPLVRGACWPHLHKLLWLSAGTPAMFQELAGHKILDGALLSFAAPSGSYLSGVLAFYCASHAMDLEALRLITPK